MRMRMSAVVLCVLMVASCDLTGPRDFPHSVATVICGPADGGATAIFLSRDSIQGLEPDYPYVGVTIWQPPGVTGSWQVDEIETQITARYVTGPAEYEAAIGGTVRIVRAPLDSRVEGSVELRFPSRFVAESFSASWIHQLMICG